MAVLPRNNARADANGSTSTSMTIFSPAGFLQVDDVVVMTLTYYTTVATPVVLTPGAGWTLYRTDEQVHATSNKIVTSVYYRVITTATSTQTSTTWTFSVPTEAIATSSSFSGCNTTTPFDVAAEAGITGTNAGGGGTATTATAVSPSVTPSAANGNGLLLNVFAMAVAEAGFTAPTGEGYIGGGRSNALTSQYVSYLKLPATPAATGTKTGTYSAAREQAKMATSLVMLAAPSPPVRYRSTQPNTTFQAGAVSAWDLRGPAAPTWVAGDYVLALFNSSTTGVSATPPGYTLLGSYTGSGDYWQVFGKVAAATAAAPTADDIVNVSISPSAPYRAFQVAFTNPSPTNPLSGFSGVTDTTASTSQALGALTSGNPNAADVVMAAGPTGTPSVTGMTAWTVVGVLTPLTAVETVKGTQPSRSITWSAATAGQKKTGLRFTLNNLNNAPNAPTLTAPTSNSYVNRAATQRVAWTFSDPDLGDTQSAADVQWRQGAGAFTLVALTGPNGFYDFAAGTFTAAQVEVQVRTYDSFGLVGPWSPSLFFNAADMPGVPTITAPINNATIASASMTVAWTSGARTGYQVRTVADNAGAANTSVVYTDTGQVIDSVTSSLVVSTAVNNRTEHVQVSVQANGLWSSFADVTYLVSFTPPATPALTVTPSSPNANVTIAVSNPTPTGGQPTVTSWDIYRRRTLVGDAGIRIAAGIGTTFIDQTPSSGVDHQYFARVNATNGTTADSAWTG